VIAMILAAGRGERMRPLTDQCPKPLLAAGGRPLIGHLLAALATAGFARVVVNTAHLGEHLERSLGDGRTHGLRIDWSREDEALETAGGIALALARRLLPTDEPFLVVNGDIWLDLDFATFAARARRELEDPRTDAHLLLVDNPAHHPRGDFDLHDGRVVGELPEGAIRLTFAGVGVYRPALFADLAPGARAALAPRLHSARDRGALSAERHAGRWFDIGTPQRLAELDRALREGF
jgi:MurNAc alpha-1-phosphate uridylyltransferase